MKTKHILVLFVLVLIVSCSKNEEVNLATDITPRVPPTEKLNEVIGMIRAAGSNPDRMRIIQENNWLTNRLVLYARKLEQIPQSTRIDSLIWYYGSADAQAEDRNKKVFEGKIVHEPVALIYFDGKKEPVMIILYCQNGMFGSIDDLEGMSRLGNTSLDFTISKGQGINRYVDYQTSIDLAEYFGLSLYKGKAMHAKNLISPEVARGLESEVERVQVTVRVYTGDYFNLSDMTYTPALR